MSFAISVGDYAPLRSPEMITSRIVALGLTSPLESSANGSAKRPEVFWRPEADPKCDHGKPGIVAPKAARRLAKLSAGVPEAERIRRRPTV